MKFLNDMLDFFLIIDNSFKPSMNKDILNDVKKYEKLVNDLEEKEKRIKQSFIDGLIEPTILTKEFKKIESDLKNFKDKIISLKEIQTTMEYKQDIETIFNLKKIEKLKFKSEYAKENNLWNKLSQEQKQSIINKYIDEIEIKVDKKNQISTNNIIFNKNEIENIGYMFHNDCFDMIISEENYNLIISNYKTEEQINNYVLTLRNFYNCYYSAIK